MENLVTRPDALLTGATCQVGLHEILLILENAGRCLRTDVTAAVVNLEAVEMPIGGETGFLQPFGQVFGMTSIIEEIYDSGTHADR